MTLRMSKGESLLPGKTICPNVSNQGLYTTHVIRVYFKRYFNKVIEFIVAICNESVLPTRYFVCLYTL